MKISLFYNALVFKAFLSFAIVLSIFLAPKQASAGLLSGFIDKVLGADDASSEVLSDSNTATHNSQTIPLPEASVNPDLKKIKEEKQVVIVSNEALLPNTSPLGVDTELEKYASSEKIDIYVVKKGDTIEGIAKKLKVSKASILASNADLKKSDLLKVGQTLVISALKSDPVLTKEDKLAKKKELEEKTLNKEKVEVKEKETAKEDTNTKTEIQQPVTVPTPQVVVNQEVLDESQNDQVQNNPVNPQGGQEGSIGNGYIWLFPKGVGRVSQGIHADQAYDFAAPLGTPVYAPYSGTVLIARNSGYNGGYGKYVVINFDDGRQAILGHMQEVLAVAGQKVNQGDVVAYVGSTGKSTGPHVHIGFRGTLSNPYKGLKVNDRDNDYAHD